MLTWLFGTLYSTVPLAEQTPSPSHAITMVVATRLTGQCR
jgi:hypothetical protein